MTYRLEDSVSARARLQEDQVIVGMPWKAFQTGSSVSRLVFDPTRLMSLVEIAMASFVWDTDADADDSYQKKSPQSSR
jgi:hypothetical protein